MKNLGLFTEYQPQERVAPGARHARNNDGIDWYTIAWDKARVAQHVYALTDLNGLVLSGFERPELSFPAGFIAWEIPKNEAPDDFLSRAQDYLITDNQLHLNYTMLIEKQRRTLLYDARNVTAQWRTELQLDIIEEQDKTKLREWAVYMKALTALDLSSISDEAGFQAIKWPDKPIE